MSLFTFGNVFTSLFVALSPLTILPIYFNMTEGMGKERASPLARQAVLTAALVAISVVLVGPTLFNFLGMTLNDLRIGGGLVLLLIALYDLVFSRERRKRIEVSEEAGVVPLGTPLIVGPGTMTSSLVLVEMHGRMTVLLALIVNLVMIWGMLHFAGILRRWISPHVARAVGKVMSLMLAGIAVSILRKGFGH